MIGEYEEGDQRTDDEKDADYQLDLMWADVNNEWVKAGGLCHCGREISLEEAFYFGQCCDCLKEEVPF